MNGIIVYDERCGKITDRSVGPWWSVGASSDTPPATTHQLVAVTQ